MIPTPPQVADALLIQTGWHKDPEPADVIAAVARVASLRREYLRARQDLARIAKVPMPFRVQNWAELRDDATAGLRQAESALLSTLMIAWPVVCGYSLGRIAEDG